MRPENSKSGHLCRFALVDHKFPFPKIGAMVHELWPPNVGPPKMSKINVEDVLANFVCILSVCWL